MYVTGLLLTCRPYNSEEKRLNNLNKGGHLQNNIGDGLFVFAIRLLRPDTVTFFLMSI